MRLRALRASVVDPGPAAPFAIVTGRQRYTEARVFTLPLHPSPLTLHPAKRSAPDPIPHTPAHKVSSLQFGKMPIRLAVGTVLRALFFRLSPAWLLDLLIKDQRKRFVASELVTGVLLVPVFTMLGTAVMAVFPTTVILLIWALLANVFQFEVWAWIRLAHYLVFLFAAGWGFGLGIRDISRAIELGWRSGSDEITAGGYRAYRLKTGRWA